MLTKSRFRKTNAAGCAVVVAAALGSGCAVNLPPPTASNPADASALEAATPLRPKLLATSQTFLSPAADDREQAAKKMNMGEMKHGSSDVSHMQHSMKGMSKGAPASMETYYTCPMHPPIHENKPGQCPICGMTLIKKSAAPEGAKP